MKEFNNIFPLSHGLSSKDSYLFDTEMLHGCVNFRPYQNVLIKFEKPLQAKEKMDYPFPQIWEGNEYRIVVNRKDIVINGRERLLNDGNLFEFADFHDFVIGISPTKVLYRNVNSGSFIFNTVGNIPTGNSMVNYNGQLLVGGITDTWYDAPQQTICWSRIGVADFLLSSSNEAGYTVLQKVNKIHKLLKLGEAVIAYTDAGMFRSVPTGLAYGFIKINDISSVSTNTIAGSVDKHFFLSTDNNLYLVTKEEVRKLGYIWLSSKLNAITVRALYNEYTQDFYITDGIRTYVFCESGLFETTIVPTTFYKDLAGNVLYVGVDSLDLTYFETPWLPFGRAGLKTLETFDLVINPTDSRFKLSCVTNTHGFGYTKKACILNKNSNATPVLTGNSFKILGTLPYTQLSKETVISKLNLRVKYCDRRNHRAGGGSYGVEESL